jgi:hypothetical protein
MDQAHVESLSDTARAILETHNGSERSPSRYTRTVYARFVKPSINVDEFFVLARASRCAHARTIARAHGTTSLRIAHRRIALSARESDPSPGLSSPRDLAAARVAADTSVARAGAAMPHRHSTFDAREPARQIGPPLPL